MQTDPELGPDAPPAATAHPTPGLTARIGTVHAQLPPAGLAAVSHTAIVGFHLVVGAAQSSATGTVVIRDPAVPRVEQMPSGLTDARVLEEGDGIAVSIDCTSKPYHELHFPLMRWKVEIDEPLKASVTELEDHKLRLVIEATETTDEGLALRVFHALAREGELAVDCDGKKLLPHSDSGCWSLPRIQKGRSVYAVVRVVPAAAP